VHFKAKAADGLCTAHGAFQRLCGLLFNSFRGRFNNVKNLFFWENNGFMFGIVSGFLAVSLIGQSHLVWILAGCAGTIVGLRSWFSFRDQRN
jgi:hypothetical protein